MGVIGLSIPFFGGFYGLSGSFSGFRAIGQELIWQITPPKKGRFFHSIDGFWGCFIWGQTSSQARKIVGCPAGLERVRYTHE